ncbi:MAG: ATP-binding protein [Pelagimonas sp.]|uniref:hybrid sensor histidine kinase/response regulator n=1 Tax=Pelagimonas sp. TaxID=2073170 RepID=UPI003D6C2E3C
MCEENDAAVTLDCHSSPESFGPDTPQASFSVKSMLTMPLPSNAHLNWVLGIHHCVEPVNYEHAIPLFEAFGKRVSSGITRMHAMQKLGQSEKRFRALVDHAPDAIMIVDADTGIFVEANPMAAQLYRACPDSIIGNYGPIELSPETQPDGSSSAEKAMGYISQAMAGEFPTFNWTHKSVDGDLIPCQISLSRFPDTSRNLVRASIVDISERVEAENERLKLAAQLSQAQKLETVGQMTGGVAHDFNNLLAVILGNLELLQLVETHDEQSRAFIKASIAATNRGAELVKKMLSFARRAQLSPQELRLNEVVTDVQTWGALTVPATIALNVSLAENLWPVMADLASTESALLNLIINARDAMNGSGSLTIETKNITVLDDDTDQVKGDLRAGHYVMLAVSDTGSGIPKDMVNRVFEPFFTTKKIGEGSGLGLSMVHGFMKQSGGSAQIYSELGSGTSVKLLFPALSAPQDTLNPARSSTKDVERPAWRILVAEDQEEVMDITVRVLQRAGHTVVAAQNGDIALGIYDEKGPFDLLLTDIVMPGDLHGPALAQALRDKNPHLPVVYMSGYADAAVLSGNDLNENDIRLMKPVSRTVLLDAIDQAAKKD